MRVSAVGSLLDVTSGINGFVAGVVEEVVTKAEVSELAAMEGVIDKEDIGVGVEIGMSAGTAGISVWLRNRATFWCLEFCQRKTSDTTPTCLY